MIGFAFLQSRIMRRLLIVSACLLAACGTRGGLTLPPKPQSLAPAATMAAADPAGQPRTEINR